jgi:hypothetical protein
MFLYLASVSIDVHVSFVVVQMASKVKALFATLKAETVQRLPARTSSDKKRGCNGPVHLNEKQGKLANLNGGKPTKYMKSFDGWRSVDNYLTARKKLREKYVARYGVEPASGERQLQQFQRSHQRINHGTLLLSKSPFPLRNYFQVNVDLKFYPCTSDLKWLLDRLDVTYDKDISQKDALQLWIEHTGGIRVWQVRSFSNAPMRRKWEDCVSEDVIL